MNFHVLTLFPEMIGTAFSTSITGRAMASGLITLNAVNIRDYAEEKRKGRIDDYSYGGGAGMIMQAEPVYRAWKAVTENLQKPRVLFMTPQGRTFDQGFAQELAMEENLVFLCGHYEGIDQRVLDEIFTMNDHGVIHEEDVRAVLRKEQTIAVVNDKAEDAEVLIDLNQPLDRINQDIIRRVLEEEHGSRTNAANRLGISRSTMWRMLKSMES